MAKQEDDDPSSKCLKLLNQYSSSDDSIKTPLNSGYEDNLFLETPPESLTCPVCLLVLKEPHLLSCCGEHICKACIEQIKSHSKPCPCCREEDYTTLLNKRMRGKVHSLKVRCANDRACSWTGELADMERHITDVCEYTAVQCTYGCGTMVPRHALKSHVQQSCTSCPIEIRMESLGHRLNNELSKLEQKYDSEVIVLKQTLAEQKGLIEELKVQHNEETTGLRKELNKLSCEIKEIKKSIQTMAASVPDNVSTDGVKKKITEAVCVNGGSATSKQTTTTKPSMKRAHPLDIPEWYTPKSPQSINVPPCVFLMNGFTQHKTDGSVWYSQPFFSSDKGYKFCLSLHANGDNTGKGSHISLYVILMKGDHDSSLKWPFKGEFHLQILNWKEDKNHVSCVIKFDEYTPKEWARRLYDVERAVNGRGKHRFLPHSNLSYSAAKNTEYLNEDRLCFQVVKVNTY